MQSGEFEAIVLGQETIHNLRLSGILRKVIGTDSVKRYLETRHLLEYLAEEDSRPIGIFLDLFSFDPIQVTDTIGYIRNQYPTIVFCLYMSNIEQNRYWQDLPPNWQFRLDHYFKLFKEPEDTELEPIVRRALYSIMAEAKHNIAGPPIRLTDDATSLPPHVTKMSSEKLKKSIFISYSRQDWDTFVSPLVKRLRDKGFSIWVDQHLLVGGDDWMDAIGEALDVCKILVLVISPDALESKFVRMEYRYFFNHDKPLIPILYRSVDRIPPELSVTQYIDFSESNDNTAFLQLAQSIDEKLGG